MTKTYKTKMLYTSLYGREAYEVWKAREAEIDSLRLSGTCSKASIVKMYEDNLRQLKAAGEKSAVDVMQTGSLGGITAAA